jgi:hypothetical protein
MHGCSAHATGRKGVGAINRYCVNSSSSHGVLVLATAALQGRLSLHFAVHVQDPNVTTSCAPAQCPETLAVPAHGMSSV